MDADSAQRRLVTPPPGVIPDSTWDSGEVGPTSVPAEPISQNRTRTHRSI
jgi:hypothetical protein